MRIGVTAPGGPILPEVAEKTLAWAAEHRPGVEIVFHPHCTMGHGHFAGPDAVRASALLEFANDDGFDAIWFARGGYGSFRIAEDVLAKLNASARRKAWLGYSDLGVFLSGLTRDGFERVAHGPMPGDIRREGGEQAIARALNWLVDGDESALEPSLLEDPRPAAAFNLIVLSHLMGTPLEPKLDGCVLMLEEVFEAMYRIDRALGHVLSVPAMRRVAGLRLGRCDPVTPNEPDFAQTEEQLFRFWCERAGVPYLGRADIGHDVCNRVVPFGPRQASSRK